MDCRQHSAAKQSSEVLHNVELNRRSANYKPNIWKYDFLQSLTSSYDTEEHVQQFEKLVDKVKDLFVEERSILAKLELIDSIQNLGLSNHFQKEIKKCLETIFTSEKKNLGIYETALSFRLLRQFGYSVSQSSILADKNILQKSSVGGIKEIIELLDGSHLAFEGEIFLDEVRTFTTSALKDASADIHGDHIKQVVHALELPSHWRVQWFDVKWHISQYQKREDADPCLLDLAKLNFNMTQTTLQKEVKELSRWWKNLDLKKDLNFARDRLVECFMCAAGVASEPKYKSLRKWLTKVINLVLVIDDVYDIYASFEELKQFTVAVERWDGKELLQLPEYMRVCFRALNDVIMETAHEIEGQVNFSTVLSYIKKSWVDFCKALYQEAQWYKEGYIPSLQEYLSNAWISSSGPVILLHVLFATMHEQKNGIQDFLQTNQDLIYNVSLIIRLCNDLGTAVAERERGDSASSILCYMNEMNVSEEAARKHIKETVKSAWKKINEHCFTQAACAQSFVSLATNAARVAHTLYQNGDGFGIQDRDIKLQILSLVIEPFPDV